ncbi:hypothetical protein Tsubulata_029654, partial [Turnera subulata]
MGIDILPLPDSKPPTFRTYLVDLSDHRSFYTTVTATPSVVRRWISQTIHYHRRHLSRLVVGLGVQWNPSSVGSAAATLQLCVGCRCLIFQLHQANYVPQSLRRFLEHPRNTFVGVWNHMDAGMLLESRHKLRVGRIVDLRHVAGARMGMSRKVSMERLTEVVLGLSGVEKDGKIGRSNWEKYWLSHEQVKYAGADAA